jgi:hypothetical protein
MTREQERFAESFRPLRHKRFPHIIFVPLDTPKIQHPPDVDEERLQAAEAKRSRKTSK